MKPLNCPWCERQVGKHDLPQEPPRKGDVAVCLHCATVSLYTYTNHGELELRKPDIDEMLKALQHPRVQKVFTEIKMNRTRHEKNVRVSSTIVFVAVIAFCAFSLLSDTLGTFAKICAIPTLISIGFSFGLWSAIPTHQQRMH